jgi:DNA invertase Pin-like site-specific DNA recombinase
MAEGKFVSYLRVSTIKQGRSGLGLEAQRAAVETFLDGGRWKIIEEFVETESGKRDDRPALQRALTSCRIHHATLAIAKLDRLSRDAAFLLNLQKAGVRFVACDMPEADNFTVGIFALLAQKERELISSRTREALAAAKRRGVRLGGNRGNLPLVARKGALVSAQYRSSKAQRRADDLMPIIGPLVIAGRSMSAIAAELNAKGIPAARGGSWQPTQVSRVIARSHGASKQGRKQNEQA